MKNKNTVWRYAPKISSAAGLLFVCFGFVSFFKQDVIIQYFLNTELRLTPNSKSYFLWKNIPAPLYMDVYFFNWTNPDKLNKEKPVLTEMGPYRYIENQNKIDIVWNDNGTVSYKKIKTWHFDGENSAGSLDDEVVTLNPIALGAITVSRDWSIFMKRSLSFSLALTGQKIYIRKTIRELMFDGYDDRLLNLVQSLPSFGNMRVPIDRFAWIYKKNGSIDGSFNVGTGENDLRNLGQLKTWNYLNKNPVFNEGCNLIVGSANEFFPHNHSRETPLIMFSTELKRPVTFKYVEDRIVDGILGYHYVLDEQTIDNGTINPENSCYCNGQCSPSGVLNVSSGMLDVPLFFSYPHFYLADSYYRNSVDGMKPDQNKHQFSITLEPSLGIPLEFKARIQISMLLHPVSGFRLYSNVPKVYFPMIWFDEYTKTTESSEILSLINLFHGLPKIIWIVSLAHIVAGIFIIIISITIMNKRKSKILHSINYNDEIKGIELQFKVKSSTPLIGNTDDS